MSEGASASACLVIGLAAVIVAADIHDAWVLTSGEDALPFGAFDPAHDRTFELALRSWVRSQTGFDLGYVEQLYTFGDRGRDLPSADLGGDTEQRVISVGYLGLTPEHKALSLGRWYSWYDFFPWEDWRQGRPDQPLDAIQEALDLWVARSIDHQQSESRTQRIEALFPRDFGTWHEERALERYELLYEIGFVAEAFRDAGRFARAVDYPLPAEDPAIVGRTMRSDHRRILATGLGRLRAKIQYRPVIYELMPEIFTLSELQKVTESIRGSPLHKQNFRRSVENAGQVVPVPGQRIETGGRPAALFRYSGPLRRPAS